MEILRSKPVRFVAIGATVLCGLSGCSDKPSDRPVAAQTCKPIDDTWGGVPPNINFEKTAQRLGVAAEDVRLGIFGKALCEQGVRLLDIERNAEITKVAVPTIAEYCLAFTVKQPKGQPFYPDVPYTEIGVVCPRQ